MQFEKLPFREEGGCWYYRAASESWGWVVFGVESGVDLRKFPECEHRVREKILARDLALLGVGEVAAAVDEVKFEMREECGGGNWDIYPGKAGSEDCEPMADTGLHDGVVVVNWQEAYRGVEDAVCWVHEVASGEWKSFQGEDPVR